MEADRQVRRPAASISFMSLLRSARVQTFCILRRQTKNTRQSGKAETFVIDEELPLSLKLATSTAFLPQSRFVFYST
jgi:hypothetical protein